MTNAVLPCFMTTTHLHDELFIPGDRSATARSKRKRWLFAGFVGSLADIISEFSMTSQSVCYHSARHTVWPTSGPGPGVKASEYGPGFGMISKQGKS